ncbi:MAG: translocation/assembly module TamB domain-containing protein, partial [Bacteroidales bacterium]|nr:translocation/assembly module TamB domain-containing protein [Bacteroidales bacterium]
DAEIQLEIDKTTGDILKARGNGQIGITVEGEKFDIKGDYRVDSGNYHFGMLGFTARDFSINPGGTIAFVGDVMQSDLDLTATYRTKASISPLIADSTAVSMRRTVDCGISLSGKLANPDIKFNIDIPDLDPTTQSRVQSALNTEDKRMKQALALLISGGFVPDEQSGIVNNTTLLYANASEMMASQLNNIFRQLDIPLDLGFNYQPSENGRNIFDVAVSTQLFNNRVIINGNIGNRQYLSSSASDIVGDLDIEIKLNRQGQLRLTLFSHSADQYSNYLDLSQRNGAGIVYQEDFNSVADLWRKIFRRKNNDEQQTFPDSDAPRRPRPE